jgi:surface antigen
MIFRNLPTPLGLALLAALAAAAPHGAGADELTSASSLDDTDRQDRQDAIDRVLTAAPGDQETWSNIDSGHRGAVRTVSERPGENGETCRDIAETVWFFDGQQSGTMVACRAGGAPWRIVSSSLDTAPAPPAANPVSQPNGIGNLPVQVWIGAPRTGVGTTVVTPQPGVAPASNGAPQQ